MDIENILQRHGVFCLADFEKRVEDGEEKLEADLYEYYLNSGEMPVGTAKARTGDPSEFIYSNTVDYLNNRVLS